MADAHLIFFRYTSYSREQGLKVSADKGIYETDMYIADVT